jgi:D-3-phosphoglycerate dehydrogenase
MMKLLQYYRGITMKVLIADKLAKAGLGFLKAQKDVEFDNKPGLTPAELAAIIGQYDGVIIRSGVKITAEVMANHGHLRCIARAGVGVDNVEVPVATAKGIIVMNTPGGNTISTAELTWALMLAMSRKLVGANNSLRAGKWERKNFEGTQLAGKTLGIVGMGRIGKEVAKRGLAMDMRVIAYDPYFAGQMPDGGVEIVKSLEELCKRSDYITIHAPKSSETSGMIGAAQIAAMKDGVRLVNAARGGIIDPAALLDGLNSGKVAGAAIDVWTKEPPDSEAEKQLIAHDKVLAMPHLGASTEEAQEQVSLDASAQLVEALRGGEIRNAVNAPGFDSALSPLMRRYAELAYRMGAIVGAVTPGALRKVEIVYRGAVSEQNVSVLTTYVTVGLIGKHMSEPVNIINAPVIARERGVEIEVVTSAQSKDFASLIQLAIHTDQGGRTAVGTLFGRKFPRIIALDNYRMEMLPEGPLAIMFLDDKPGVIGAVGAAFGEAGVNIAHMTFGRKKSTNKAVLAVNLDSPASEDVQKKLLAMDFMEAVYSMVLPALTDLDKGGPEGEK